jgi:hypothetical protein
MDPKETKRQRLTRVAKEISPFICQQARSAWKDVRTAERNEPGRHVWRFRPGPGEVERFLHIDHGALTGTADSAARVLNQLQSEQWLDRLQKGPATALHLSKKGVLTAFGA